MIFGGGADHAGAADVDILDDLIAVRAFGNSLGKGVEVDHHQIDRADLVLSHGSSVFRIVTHREQPAVNLGVQRLDPPVHHLGKAGQVGNVHDGQPSLAQRLGGSPGRDQLNPAQRQRLAQLGQTSLVGH